MTRPGRSRLKTGADAGPLWLDATSWTSMDSVPGDFHEWFSAEVPRELEIGCGLGLFLQQISPIHPGRNFVGLEIANKVARVAALRCHRAGISNVRILTGDARKLLPIFPNQAFERVHIYFPDPWWKRRHRKRRIVDEDVISQVERVLSLGGRLHLATDVEEYFRHMQKLLTKFPGFQASITESFLNVGPGYLTHFERKFLQQGKTIWRTCYDRTRRSNSMVDNLSVEEE